MNHYAETVICIDNSARMSSCIDAIKKSVLQWNDTLLHVFEHSYISISKVYIKVITFTNNNKPIIKESRWFEISNKKGLEPEYLIAYIKKIKCLDSDADDLSFEAIERAKKVDWTSEKASLKNVILFTNSICNKRNLAQYIEGCSMNDDSPFSYKKRLVVFAPEIYPWPELYESLGNMIFCPFRGDLTSEDIDLNLEGISFGMLDSIEF